MYAFLGNPPKSALNDVYLVDKSVLCNSSNSTANIFATFVKELHRFLILMF